MKAQHNAGSRVKQRRRIMRAVKINEISAVDVPAQEGAVAVIMKRTVAPTRQTELNVEKGSALTTADDGHTHLLALIGHGGDELNSGMTSWVDEHSHPWVRTPTGEIVIGMARAIDDGEPHDHRIGVLSKFAEDEAAGNQEDNSMTDATQKTEAEKKAEEKVEELQKDLARANSLAALNDADKAHLDTLKGDEVDAFLAKSADERKTVIDGIAKEAEAQAAKDKEDDAVVYTTKDGVELRKSAGSDFIALARSNDDLRKRLDESEDVRKNDSFRKRAEDELSHLPGDLETRVEMLKALDTIKDKDRREAALNALRAQDEALKVAFDTHGHGSTPEPGSAEDELETLAKAHGEKHPELTIEQAHAAVLKTAQGGELYAKTISH